MPEEITKYVAPICVIPKQSLMAAEIAQLRIKLGRQRKDSSKKEVQALLDMANKKLTDYLKSIGR